MAANTEPIKLDPLPPAPKPLDPRAQKQAPKSYQDLDGAAEGDVDLAYVADDGAPPPSLSSSSPARMTWAAT